MTLIRFAWGTVAILRVANSSKPKNGPSVGELLSETAAAKPFEPPANSLSVLSDRSQRIRLRTFSGQGSPFISWLTGDIVFVPESFDGWSQDERVASLQHELAHIHRGDHFGRLFLDQSK